MQRLNHVEKGGGTVGLCKIRNEFGENVDEEFWEIFETI
jgi:hypothetical protein